MDYPETRRKYEQDEQDDDDRRAANAADVRLKSIKEALSRFEHAAGVQNSHTTGVARPSAAHIDDED